MFDRLEDLLIRFEEIMGELQEPDVVNNQERFRKLMKEQNDLTPIVEAYREYKECKQTIEDSLQMLDEESSIICIYYGAETDEEAANKLAEDIQEDNPDVEIEVHFGGQPIYYYVISVE